ncbi:MAG: hypothetical protein K2O15_05260 [Lachnospiraceae bacterium]|nr:hypothetical protein [Lachnospiraceae bacterium]
MTIGAISFQPYVYNVNAVSPASMNRLSRISDDVLDKKTDYSGLSQAENENPLRRGQTLDFKGMLEMQMQRGRSNAARIMKPETKAQEPQETAQTQDAAVKFERAESAESAQTQVTTAAENMQTADMNMGNGSAGSGISNFRMQQAISAYGMFMTA